MFIDLNFIYPTANASLCRPLQDVASLLHYDCIVWSRALSGRLSDEKPLVAAAHSKSAGPVVQHSLLAYSPPQPPLRQLSRLTLSLTDSLQLSALHANNPALLAYDIIAVQPNTEALFHAACSNDAIDIIVIDCSDRLPYFVKRPAVHLARTRGIRFELNYGQALRDSNTKRFLFAHAQQLLRVIKKDELIVSSGATRPSELRDPYDVINFCVLFGLSPAEAKKIVSENTRQVIMHAEARKTIKGIIRPVGMGLGAVSKPADKSAADDDDDDEDDDDEAMDEEGQQTDKKTKGDEKQKTQAQKGGQKGKQGK